MVLQISHESCLCFVLHCIFLCCGLVKVVIIREPFLFILESLDTSGINKDTAQHLEKLDRCTEVTNLHRLISLYRSGKGTQFTTITEAHLIVEGRKRYTVHSNYRGSSHCTGQEKVQRLEEMLSDVM